jgi:RND family efflux transporter MFP subunit
MLMKTHQVFSTLSRSSAFALVALGLVACGEPPPEPDADYARPVKTVVVSSPEASGIRQFAGRVDALRRVDLAFRVPGTLQELPIKEADEVETGQVIARLDPSDFKTRVNDARAAYQRAKADYDRAKELIKKDFISRTDFDKLESDFKRADAGLKQARLDLSYTELKVPFGGFISRRYVQNFEEVQAKQPIVALRDLSVLEVKFGVPEVLVQRLAEVEANEETDIIIPVTASVDAAPDRQYPLSFREFSSTADPATKTFEATYVMVQPEDIDFLPGMSANVTVDLRKAFGEQQVFLIPVTAVISDEGLNPRVWIVDESTMTIAARPVEVGRMERNEIEVLSGIEPGERIVVAGVGYLAEGMKVRPLPDREQAEDNIPREHPVPKSEAQG